MSNELIKPASADCARWLNVLSDLKYDPARGIAPHKPLLLLLVCALAEEGKLAGAMLRRDGDLAFRFSSYWRIVAERRCTKPDVKLPFFHLRTEGVWKPLEPDGRPAEDRNRAVLAQLDPSFWLCLNDSSFRTLARRTLIAKYFKPNERAELYSLVGLEVPPEDLVAADATRFLESDVKEVKRDAKFSVRGTASVRLHLRADEISDDLGQRSDICGCGTHSSIQEGRQQPPYEWNRAQQDGALAL